MNIAQIMAGVTKRHARDMWLTAHAERYERAYRALCTMAANAPCYTTRSLHEAAALAAMRRASMFGAILEGDVRAWRRERRQWRKWRCVVRSIRAEHAEACGWRCGR